MFFSFLFLLIPFFLLLFLPLFFLFSFSTSLFLALCPSHPHCLIPLFFYFLCLNLSTLRLQGNPEGAENPLSVDESLFSYGLRESIASYLSLTGDDTSSFDRKKKSLSLTYGASKRKSSFFAAPQYFED